MIASTIPAAINPYSNVAMALAVIAGPWRVGRGTSGGGDGTHIVAAVIVAAMSKTALQQKL